jgi:hypothetical protein
MPMTPRLIFSLDATLLTPTAFAETIQGAATAEVTAAVRDKNSRRFDGTGVLISGDSADFQEGFSQQQAFDMA